MERPMRPVVRRCPCPCDTAAFLAEGVGVVVALGLEGELVAWVYAGVIKL